MRKQKINTEKDETLDSVGNWTAITFLGCVIIIMLAGTYKFLAWLF